MKKINKFSLKILMFSLLFGLFNSLNAQVDFYINSQSSLTPGDTIGVEIRISSPTTSILGWDVDISYDKNILTSISSNVIITKLYPTTSNNDWYFHNTSNPNGVYLAYNETNQTLYTYPDSTLVCILKFIYNGGTTNLTGTIRGDGFYDENWESVSTTFHNGSVSGPLAPITSVAGGGNWNTGASWNLGHTPNTSNGTITINSDMTTPLVVNTNVSIDTNLIVNAGKALTVNSGSTLTVNGSFTIKDGASYVNNGVGNNTATVERYIAKDNKWHFLSSPVANQTIIGNFSPVVCDLSFEFYKWGENVVITGLPWINLRANPTTYEPTFETSFAVGRGYLVAYNSGYSGSETHAFNGVLNTGDKSIALAYSNNYYNLVGNPFPSGFDWDSITNYTTVLGATPSYSVWNGATGNYGAYTGGLGTGGATHIVAPHQGFFVTAIAGGSFTIPNAARVHPGTQGYLKSSLADFVRLHVSSTANTYSDEMIVNFNSNATANQGAVKFVSMVAQAPSLYSVKSSKNFTINTLTGIVNSTNSLVVPVGFKAGVNGTYTIKATDLNSFAATTYVYLKDLTLNTIIDLNQTATYTFAATTVDNENRFELIFALAPLAISNDVIQNNTSIYAYDNTITIKTNETIKNIAIYNTMGQLIKTVEPTKMTVNMNGYSTGNYIVKVVTDKNVYSEKVLVK